MGRLDGKLVRLTIRCGSVTEIITVTEKYTFSMITDGFVASGLIKPEERGETEYRLERTGHRYEADSPCTLGQSEVKPWDQLTMLRKGGSVIEQGQGRMRRIC